jgi:hypothetical protein
VEERERLTMKIVLVRYGENRLAIGTPCGFSISLAPSRLTMFFS